jgi:RNA polymerase sigma-70 factor, ECF subfamily
VIAALDFQPRLSFAAPGILRAAPEPLRPVSDDGTLLLRVGQSDKDAFADLYDRHAPIVYGICRRILGDAASAEDVTQSVFTMLWAKPTAFAGGNFSAWITRVARNAALDVLRSAAVRTREPEMPEDMAAANDLEDEIVARVQQGAIVDALRKLPDDQREAIEQAYFGGLSYREVAERTGAPLGTIKSRIRTGLRQLWQALQQQVAT